MDIDFSDKISALEVDKIYYQDTRKELSDQADNSLQVLNIDFNDVATVNPPKNSSDQTKRELEIIKQLQEDWNPPEDLLKRCDDDPDGIVFDLNDMIIGEDSKQKYNSKALMEDLNVFIMRMKLRYGRARPYQVSDYHNVIIDYNKKIQKKGTANTPSYPSGHTAAAYFAAGICSYHTPEAKDQFLNLANVVAMSRIKEGVHFPSDNEYSIFLVNEVLMPAYLKTLK
tara:strand:+ start:14983 stop:15663 length:681 start_codon:yes stop_codon:yes gene_type:complete